MDVPVLLIEFEGVLADTAAMRAAALVEAFGADDLSLTPALSALAPGLTTEQAVHRIRQAAGWPEDGTASEICRLRAERAFAARAGKGLSLQPAVRDAIERLSSFARLAIVTRASRREVEFALGLSGLDAMFRPVIALEDASSPKPSAAPHLAALDRMAQLFPGQHICALAIEDSVVGVRAARAAGIPSVAIGLLPVHEAVEADAWFPSLSDLTPTRAREIAFGARTGHGR